MSLSRHSTEIGMSVTIRETIGKLNAVQRKKVEDRAAELIAEEMSLRDLRKARKLTQARVAKVLGSPKTASRDSKNAAIYCSRRYEKRSRRWAAMCVSLRNFQCVSLRNFQIVRRSCCLNYPKTIRRANRPGDVRTLTRKNDLVAARREPLQQFHLALYS